MRIRTNGAALLLGLAVAAVPAARTEPAANGLSGTVKDAAGAAVGNAHLIVRGAADRDVYSDPYGRFELRSLRAGAYILVVEKAGFEPEQQSVTVAGRVEAIEVTLRPAALRQSVTVVGALDSIETLTKLPESLHETPRAVTLVGSDEMRDRNLRSVPDLLPFVPGFSVNSYRAEGYHFYARGYRMGPDDTRVDGFAGLNVGGGFGASLFGIDQAVVLRGPAGLVYGAAGSPGGLINLVTKKPQPVRSTRLDLRGGAYAGDSLGLADRPSLSFDLDSTGALTRGGRVLYRGLATLENQRYFTANVLDRNRYVNGQLTFKLDPLGLYTLTPVAQYARFNRPAGGGIVVSPSTSLSTSDGSSGPIQLGDISPLSVNTSAGGRIDETGQAGFDFHALPSDRWKLNLSYRLLRMDTFIEQWLPQVVSNAQIALLRERHQVERLSSKSDTDRRYHNVDGNASYELRGGSWKNIMQVGAYTRLARIRGTTPLGAVPAAQSPIDIYTGVLAAPLADNYPAIVKGAFADTTVWNGYFQNRTSLFSDRVVLTMGLGYGQNHPAGRPVQKGDPMPNVSLLFNPSRQLALYGSYSTSFNPTDPTLENFAGLPGVFDPVRGRNYEAGLKYDLPSRRLSAALSFFENRIGNALVQTGINDVNRNGVRYYVEAGTRRSRGAELSADGRVRPDLFVSGAVSYTSAIYTGEGPASAAATLAIPGSPAEKTPRWSWNARTSYQRSEGRLAGWGAGFSLLWQGQRLGSNGARTRSAPDPLMLPAYTRVDASLSYRINRHLDWALTVENLLDRTIFVSATVGSAIEIAAPRTATMRVGWRF